MYYVYFLDSNKQPPGTDGAENLMVEGKMDDVSVSWSFVTIISPQIVLPEVAMGKLKLGMGVCGARRKYAILRRLQ